MQYRNPNRLLKVPNIGALTEEIGGRIDSVEIPKQDQHVQRRRLPGAVDMLTIEETSGGLRLYWLDSNGSHYYATLLGIDSQEGCAIVTEVCEYFPRLNYQRSSDDGIWF